MKSQRFLKVTLNAPILHALGNTSLSGQYSYSRSSVSRDLRGARQRGDVQSGRRGGRTLRSQQPAGTQSSV